MNQQTAVYHKDMNQANHRGTIISQFYYGPEGERVGKEDYDAAGQPSSYTQYLRSGGAVLWEETWQLPAMDSASGKTYVYAGGRMAVVRESTQNASGGWDQSFEYFATDHLGTVRFSYKVDGSGTFVASSTHDYEPFGLEIGPIETSDNTHRFTGHERDAETGNDYMHARFFGANLGRFSSADRTTAGVHLLGPQTWNMYAYCENNPVGKVDPDGLFSRKVHAKFMIGFVDHKEWLHRLQRGNESIDDLGGMNSRPRFGFWGALLHPGEHFNVNPAGKPDSRDVASQKYAAESRALFAKGDNDKGYFYAGKAAHTIEDKWGHKMPVMENGEMKRDENGETVWRDVGPMEHLFRKIGGWLQKLFGHKDTLDPDSKDSPGYQEKHDKAKKETTDLLSGVLPKVEPVPPNNGQVGSDN